MNMAGAVEAGQWKEDMRGRNISYTRILFMAEFSILAIMYALWSVFLICLIVY